MKKRKHASTKKTSNRIPPSVPKCVRRCAEGYMTDFVTAADNRQSVRFVLKKTTAGYSVLRTTATDPAQIDMATDISISPSTRKLFSDLSSLKAAITAIETWLGKELPDIR